jgi:hypothetical protein
MSPQQVVQTENLNIYPNPFAFNTIINFQVSAQSKVSIKYLIWKGVK